jgi:hypothetical protein
MEAHLGSLSLLGPSGLSEVGEQVKLVSLGYNTKWSLIGGRELCEKHELLWFARLPNAKYPFRILYYCTECH